MIQKTPIPDFNKRFDVVSCFIESGEKILMLLRQDHKPQGNTWSMPAGKVETTDESLEHALSREIREELSLHIEPGAFSAFESYFVRHDGYDFMYHVFDYSPPNVPDVAIDLKDHKAYAWMAPAEALALGGDLMPDEDFCIKDRFGA